MKRNGYNKDRIQLQRQNIKYGQHPNAQESNPGLRAKKKLEMHRGLGYQIRSMHPSNSIYTQKRRNEM